jgi:kynureninase
MSAPSFTEEELRRAVWPRFSRAMGAGCIYLANHSLGRPPDRMAEDVAAAVDAWYRDLDGAWALWLEGRERFRTLTARLVGAPRPDCIIPKASAGQGLRAVLNALPGKPQVVASAGEFDSIAFVLAAYREQGRIELALAPWRELSAAGADLVVLSTVMFESGEIVAELPQRVRDAHRAGARVLLDVYHHAGALPLDLAALEADFAIGGSYKYLRGGPGAGWLYVRPDLTETLRSLDAGWFARAEPFAWSPAGPSPQWQARAPGGDAWLEATPAVLAPFQALAGLEFTLELGVDRLRAHNLEQKRTLAQLLAGRGIPAQGAGEEHGAFLTVVHPEAARIAAELRARGVRTDARGRHLRLGPDLLNTRQELERAASALGEVLG